jgi:hypothetical protein
MTPAGTMRRRKMEKKTGVLGFIAHFLLPSGVCRE